MVGFCSRSSYLHGSTVAQHANQTIVMSVEKKEKHRKVVNIGKSRRHKCHIYVITQVCALLQVSKNRLMLIFKCHCGKQREKAQK